MAERERTYSWMQGDLMGAVHLDGHIECHIAALRGMDTPRPRSFQEAGADEGVFEQIRLRRPGPFRTKGFLGGATAVTVPTDALAWLDDRLMNKLRLKYGSWGDEALLLMVRNTAAGAVWNAAEACGGMAERPNLPLEQLREVVELGVYRDDGWLRFRLPPDLAEHQAVFDEEQAFWWRVVRPDFPRQYEAPIEFCPIGRDTFDGRRTDVTVGPVGDFAPLSIANLHLPTDAPWRILDTESRPGKRDAGEAEWIALRRIVMVVAPREGKSPIGFHFSNRTGELHPGGIHIALSGEAWKYNLTHIGRAAIEALGWEGPKEKR